MAEEVRHNDIRIQSHMHALVNIPKPYSVIYIQTTEVIQQRDCDGGGGGGGGGGSSF